MACRNLFVIAAICITLNTTSPETTSAQDEKICPVGHWPAIRAAKLVVTSDRMGFRRTKMSAVK